MQAALDLGEDHVSEADVLSQISELVAQRENINLQIEERKIQLKHIRSGVILRCAHCDKEYPYRELVFVVEERYSHTPAYEDAVYIEQNWGYTCPSCKETSWWTHPVAADAKSIYGIRKLFKSTTIISTR